MIVRRWFAAVFALALLASACGGDADDTATPDDAPPAEAPTPGEPADDDEVSDVDADEVDRDARLRYGYYISVSRMDPHLANGSQDNPWLFPAYDRLVHNTPAAEPIPGLAESWEFSEDGLQLEMQLRQGVVFHDGEPFNAEAVRANIERGQTVEGSAVASSLTNITSVEPVDEHTVRFNLASPDASLPLLLSDRAGAIISPAAFDNPDLDQIPVGAGPYRVVDHIVDDRVIFERFEDYWDPDSQLLGSIEFILLSDTQTRLNALISGQIDAAELDAPQIDQAERAGLTVTLGEDVSFGLVQFNSALRPEFAEEGVIRAIHHAIDREAITQGVFQGYAQPTVQSVPEGYFAHDPAIGPDHYEYDPELARQLLADAGFADGFSFELLTTTVPARVQTSEAIQAMLGEVGIDVTVRPVAGAGPFLDEVYGAATAEAWMLAWGGRPDPSMTLGLLYLPGSFNNPSNRSTDRIQELHQQSLTTFDEDERAQVLQELSAEIATSETDVIPLYFPQKVLAHNERVVGIQLWTAGRPELRGVGMLPE
jgi:peptide/nickel transport system substrate-binding protein